MPKQSLLRFIKRWKRYEPRKDWSHIPESTRGVYVLYSNGSPHEYRVVYIRVAGLGPTGGGGIRSRIKRHERKVKKWTHFSFFEVHDNVTRDEIRELEALLLGIFRHDPRIELANKQKGSTRLYKLRNRKLWLPTGLSPNAPRQRIDQALRTWAHQLNGPHYSLNCQSVTFAPR